MSKNAGMVNKDQTKKKQQAKQGNRAVNPNQNQQLIKPHDSASMHAALTQSTPMKPDDVLYLQRVLGNQAAQDVIHRAASEDPNQTDVVQRETGLRQGSAVSMTGGTADAFVNNTANADKSPTELISLLESTLNTSLNDQNVPPITVVQANGGGNDGTFDFETWTIEIDPDSVFAGKTKISELTPEEVRGVADTLHHEARHCEQWFRMARLLAGQKLGVPQVDGSPADETTVAQEIADEMGIPPSAALWATQSPLTTGDEESAEAQEWYDSVYGANSAYRELVLGSLDTAISDVAQPITDLQNAIALKGEASTDYDREQTQSEIDYLVMNINALLQTLYDVRDGGLTTELNRLSAMTGHSAVEATMLTHTTNFINLINTIEGLSVSENTAAQVQTLVDQLSDESYQAYRDLPEETDAWAAGGAVTAVMQQGVSIQ